MSTLEVRTPYSVILLLSFSFVNNRMHFALRVASLLFITFVNTTTYNVESTLLISFPNNSQPIDLCSVIFELIITQSNHGSVLFGVSTIYRTFINCTTVLSAVGIHDLNAFILNECHS